MDSKKGCIIITVETKLMLLSVLFVVILLQAAVRADVEIKINPKVMDANSKRSNKLTYHGQRSAPAPSNNAGKRMCYHLGHECWSDPTLCCHNCGCIMPIGVCFGINC